MEREAAAVAGRRSAGAGIGEGRWPWHLHPAVPPRAGPALASRGKRRMKAGLSGERQSTNSFAAQRDIAPWCNVSTQTRRESPSHAFSGRDPSS